MSMIFPGMDPYLEKPHIWQGFHNRMAIYLADLLQPLLGSRYIAASEERVFVEGPRDRETIPDAWVTRARIQPRPAPTSMAILEADAPEVAHVSALEIHETYVEILDRQSEMKVVTVIELLSPTNKYAGPGRDSHLTKQREVRRSDAHLIEIDLLRTGPHVLAVPEMYPRSCGPYDYITCVNRAGGQREDFEFYRTRLRQRLPRILVPLADNDPDVVLDLQTVVAFTYDKDRYRERVRYDRPCVPPLPPEDQAWADELIRAASQ